MALEIQELIDHSIGFLRHSPSDLRICALVSRSWVDIAQSHLFRAVSIKARGTKTDGLWSRLQDTLRASPHLTRHIRQLDVDGSRLSIEKFSELCNFPFTHLESVAIAEISELCISHGVPMQQLFSLPTLVVVRLIWSRCSTSIRHLDLFCHSHSSEAFLPIPRHPPSIIRLESLRIPIAGGASDWLKHELCQFDFSGLRELSILDNIEVISWPKMAPSLPIIEILHLAPVSSKPLVDLSSLPNLAELHIMLYSRDQWPASLRTLSTIMPSHRIRRIVISGILLDAEICDQLDSQLSSFPVHDSLDIVLSMIPTECRRVAPYFHRLASRKMLNYGRETGSPRYRRRV
ncbi:hypothetical protein B0H17DRAFT_1130538 [Mycena rosella]|uniref:F-box domain-containing protein n=1 Tax=Mycena rosella TaxID=1033263 RepID=A0AAD7DRB5_MYCRO|nr:hypothetical protein B0H17DRAFT_1130538 [Mycena rosella]